MNITGMLVLAGCYLLGSCIAGYVSGIPASVIGIFILFGMLLLLRRVPEGVDAMAGSLLRYLPLMLVVPAVGIIDVDTLELTVWLRLLLVIALSLVVTVPLCGLLLQYLIRRKTDG